MITCCIFILSSSLSFSAYHHQDENDSDNFLQVYPDKKESKLDNCALCHTGGSYEKYPDSGKYVSLGSCQWCHHIFGYDASGNIVETLNNYGKDYYYEGRNSDAIKKIESKDSDGDGFTNIVEIQAIRYPGDADDDPDKTIAPYRVYTREELSSLTQHTQFMLMNTSRSGDFYAEYTGVPLETLLEDAGILDTATGITAYAPDGWSTYHPLNPLDESSSYHIIGTYEQASYYYDEEATSWCNYSAPLCSSYSHGNPIYVSGGLKSIIALQRNGTNLDTGVLNTENKLDGEGPYRIVVPQKVPSAPDQSEKSDDQNVIWPYNSDWDHNAGFCTRSVTIIKVEPLPEGTTDIDVMEAGWDFIDKEKIIIYGAIKAGGISGQLFAFDGNEKAPLTDATVTIVETGHIAATKQDGTFTFENIAVGDYSISVEHEGIILLTRDSIKVDESTNTQLPVYTIYVKNDQGDVNNDGTMGLEDIIHWLKVLAGMVN